VARSSASGCRPRAWVAGAALALGVSVALSTTAPAHFERPGHFPDPAADTSVAPAAGGEVPRYRRRGRELVVCKRGSLRRARNLGATRKQMRRNRRLVRRCRFRNIQSAVSVARNGARIFVLPGVYLEEPSRRQPTFDPACKKYLVHSEEQRAGEEPQALSYTYQARCPNDQNLIAVLGRDEESGACVRCNLTIEGTGRQPGDVLIDSGASGALQGKDVGLRGDRADGLYLLNLHVRRAGEHGVYLAETDGYVIDRVIASDNRNYGFLTFVSDHGLHDRCEAYGNSNAGVYPGAAPDSRPRLNQRLTRCDSHHNVLGYSGTMGNSVLAEDNDFHHNTVGISTDSYLAAGHPGYPQDSAVFRNNRIYSNNLNPYVPGSGLIPSFPFPVGTGILITGGNDNLIEGNRIYDNWRRGTMLITLPGPVSTPPQPDVDATSHRNTYRRNVMGVGPDGRRMPNGVDFWWDEAGRNNCWEDNGQATSDPVELDRCPGRSFAPPALGNPDKQRVLASCATWPDPVASAQCDWFTTPPPPAGRAASAQPVRALRRSPPPASDGGSTVNSRHSCEEWRRATPRSRRAAVNGLRSALAADLQFRGIAIVPEQVAIDHIDRACGQPFARGFSLFELFTAHATFYAAAQARPG
jgi:Right handed beta helix region